MKEALIVVDMQNDFCDGGALPVLGGHVVARNIADLISDIDRDQTAIIYTMDWHNPEDDNGGHFSSEPDYIDTWPHHCVANTYGAELHPIIAPYATNESFIFRKGQGAPSYSGFDGVNGDGQNLNDFLKGLGVENVVVAGLAADYCVEATANDAIKNGFDTKVSSYLYSAGISDSVYSVANRVANRNNKAKRGG